MLTGEYAGQTAVAHNYQNSALDKDKLFETGDTAHAMVQMGANGLTVTLIDHYRLGAEGWIFAALALRSLRWAARWAAGRWSRWSPAW